GNEVDRSIDDATWTVVTTSLSASATSYTDTGLSDGTIYYYRVKATTSALSTSSSVTSATTVLPAPTGLTVTTGSPVQIQLAWTDNSTDETGFAIERSTDGTTFSTISTTAANAAIYN